MDYTLEDLVAFIARDDEHRDYYQEQLENLIREREAKAWDEGHDAGWNSRDEDAARGWVPSGVHESDAVNPYRKAVQS